jgi:hypothetical protein
MIICVSTVKPGAGLYPKHHNVWRSPPGAAGGLLGVANGAQSGGVRSRTPGVSRSSAA